MNGLEEATIKPAAEQKEKVFLKPPSFYTVIMHNDDFTPMEFVVEVLGMFFNKDYALATTLMYEIHHQGRAACGIYTKDVAETKSNQVMTYARQHDHPLLCSVEVV